MHNYISSILTKTSSGTRILIIEKEQIPSILKDFREFCRVDLQHKDNTAHRRVGHIRRLLEWLNDEAITRCARNRRKLTNVIYNSGLNDANRLVEALKVERNLHGCAVAIIAMNCVYGIKSCITRENNNEIVIHATKCLWKDKENWTPRVCASIESYDIGLVKGINKNVKYLCTRRRSKGDKICEIILKRK